MSETEAVAYGILLTLTHRHRDMETFAASPDASPSSRPA